jgi:hypothetical protein
MFELSRLKTLEIWCTLNGYDYDLCFSSKYKKWQILIEIDSEGEFYYDKTRETLDGLLEFVINDLKINGDN